MPPVSLLPYVQVQPLNDKEMAVTTGVYVRSGLLGFVGNVRKCVCVCMCVHVCVYTCVCVCVCGEREREIPLCYRRREALCSFVVHWMD